MFRFEKLLNTPITSLYLTLCLMIAGLSAGPAVAVDGVAEINQACAAVGCFAGDTPGFPVTIGTRGSYRLTSNLDVTVSAAPANTTAIEVDAGETTIDLNGFTILGPVTCSGGSSFSPVTSCAPTGGSGLGVRANAGDVTIRNGYVRGMGLIGVSCGRSCRVEDIVASHNGLIGITNANDTGIFLRNIVDRNGGDGMFISGQAEDNVVTRNLGRGLFSNPDSRIAGNQVLYNAGDGVRCASCLLLDNVISDNLGFGTTFVGRPAYGRNLFDNNTLGELSGSGIQVDINRCGFVACP